MKRIVRNFKILCILELRHVKTNWSQLRMLAVGLFVCVCGGGGGDSRDHCSSQYAHSIIPAVTLLSSYVGKQ